MTNCQFIAVLLIIQCFALATLAENSTVNISPSIVAAADSSSFGELPTGNYYPFQVQLRLPNETPYCGGYVITTFLVLTAAHCVHKDQINSVEVVGGHYNGSINHEQIGKIQEVFIHDEYNATERRNDIALVVLQTELIYNSFVSPAKIPYNVTRTVNDSQPSDGFLWDATKYFDWIQDKYLLSTLIFGCPGGFFRCLNDQCVDPRGLCDGSEDCGDTSDEDRDTCDVFGSYKPTFRLQAPATMYQCYYRYFEENRSQLRLYKYISRDMVCDGNVDCSHRSEERRCNNCSSDAYHCQESSECIPRDDRCDGNPNCEKGEDERNCLDCNKGLLLCPSEGKCIGDFYRCDGIKHCQDNSDEMNCDKCAHGELFHCSRSKKCIPRDLVCNGRNECGDNQDEEGCPDFRCYSGEIIPHSKRCNWVWNCRNGEDEKNCGRANTRIRTRG